MSKKHFEALAAALKTTTSREMAALRTGKAIPSVQSKAYDELSAYRREYRKPTEYHLVDVLNRFVEAVDMSDTTDDVAVRMIVEEAREAIAKAKGENK